MTNVTLADPTYYFLTGAACMGSWACGLFFLRSWWRSGDRLFFLFGSAFWLMTLERILLLCRGQEGENELIVYSIRLLAFLVILLGIWDKNRAPASRHAYGS